MKASHANRISQAVIPSVNIYVGGVVLFVGFGNRGLMLRARQAIAVIPLATILATIGVMFGAAVSAYPRSLGLHWSLCWLVRGSGAETAPCGRRSG